MRPIDYLQKMNKGGFISKLFNKPSKADIEALIPVLETTNIPSEDLSYVNIADELINSSEGAASEEDLAIQTFKRYLKMGPHLPKPSKPEVMGGLGVPVEELMKRIGKQEGGEIRRQDFELPNPNYVNVSTSMDKRDREYYSDPEYFDVQKYLMPEYQEFLESTGNQFGFPERTLVDMLNQSTINYGTSVVKTQDGKIIKQPRNYNPFFAVQEWAKIVDPEGNIQAGEKEDIESLKELKKLYNNYIKDSEKSRYDMSRMTYDANKNIPFSVGRGNFANDQERKEQPLKNLQSSAKKVFDYMRKIVSERPIAKANLFNRNNPTFLDRDAGEIYNFFEGQRQPSGQSTYDSDLNIGMQEGGMVFETAMADNTAHSQMDRLIAENEMNQMPRTPFSFLDRDRIDRENQELMDIAMSASMPMMGAMKIKKFSPKIMNMMAQLSKNPSYENNLLRRTLKGYNRLGSSKPTDEINIKNLLRYLESK